MLSGLRARLQRLLARVRRVERRELREFRRWVEHTNNLLHLSVLVFVPLLIAFVTYISNASPALSFLLFPPLASGTYTLFSDPEGKYASPPKFVGGMTVGAVCGFLAIEITGVAGVSGGTRIGIQSVSTLDAGVSIFLTGAVTWALDLEEPTAFSTALLTLLTGGSRGEYVLSVIVSTTFIATAFYAWRELFYDRRAEYLYRTTQGDDHVLVPVRGETADETAMFGAHIAAAHDAGKVVLLDLVSESEIAEAEAGIRRDEEAGSGASEAASDADGTDPTTEAAEQVAGQAAMRLERLAGRIQTRVGVPCEVVVASESGSPANVVLQAAQEANCDLVVTPYEERHGSLSPFVKSLFDDPIDVVAFRSVSGRSRWRRVLVAVARPGDNAHAMLDFAQRVSRATGTVSVCTCIDTESHRRRAESMLVNLVEPFDGTFETRVSRDSIERFLSTNAPSHDLVVVGASTDRTGASRFLAPPTFEKLRDVDCDVAIVHRGG
ncbi:HPP family protein [Haloarchaeobius sp. FL176]|uniref:HPP family protein n=1 Tax=Haloarchaeobius sp. FL176 TaxID=2967129 RepID=UPI002147846A|nr:HPP family protein [Haloarchaeobius sp. FL176]